MPIPSWSSLTIPNLPMSAEHHERCRNSMSAHCWVPFSPLWKHCGCLMSRAEAVTMSFPTKPNLACEKNGVTSHKKLGSAHFLREIRGQLFFPAVHIYAFRIYYSLNTVLCTMCPAHIRSWECSHMLTYPSVYLLSTASVWSEGKGCHVSLIYQGHILFWKATGLHSPTSTFHGCLLTLAFILECPTLIKLFPLNEQQVRGT